MPILKAKATLVPTRKAGDATMTAWNGWLLFKEANTADDKKTEDPKNNPDLKDIEPGSDADATPLPEVGKTPPDPSKKKSD